MFNVLLNSFKTAGKFLLSPFVSFIGGILSILAAAWFNVLQTIMYWIFSLFVGVVELLFGNLGTDFTKLDATDNWAELNAIRWGGDMIWAMYDLGIFEAFFIIMTAYIIKIIMMVMTLMRFL